MLPRPVATTLTGPAAGAVVSLLHGRIPGMPPGQRGPLDGVLELLLCWFAGEAVARLSGLPVPGPVIGLLLLLGWLRVRPRRAAGEAPSVPVADGLLRVLPLLFVPAGVGVVAFLPLLRDQWLPALVGLVLPLVLSLVVTGTVTGAVLRRRETR